MEQMETAQRLAGCSFAVGGVPFRGELKAPIEQMETARRLAGCSFGVGGVPFWDKLRASSKLPAQDQVAFIAILPDTMEATCR